MKKNGITSEQLSEEIDQLSGMIRRFEYYAGVGLLTPASTPSNPPSGENVFFVDLIFYHRVLKCHVLVELKTAAFAHEYLGQRSRERTANSRALG